MKPFLASLDSSDLIETIADALGASLEPLLGLGLVLVGTFAVYRLISRAARSIDDDGSWGGNEQDTGFSGHEWGSDPWIDSAIDGFSDFARKDEMSDGYRQHLEAGGFLESDDSEYVPDEIDEEISRRGDDGDFKPPF